MTGIKLKNKDTLVLSAGTSELMVTDPNGVIGLAAEGQEELVLGGLGVTFEQVKAIQEREGQLITANTHAAAPHAQKYLDDHAEASEVKLSYNFGHNLHEVFYDRQGNTTHISTATAVGDHGDLAEVKAYVSKLFQSLNA